MTVPPLQIKGQWHTIKVYLPIRLGDPGCNALEDFTKHISVHPQIGMIVLRTLAVQLLDEVVIGPKLYPPLYGGPWFDPPSLHCSGLSLPLSSAPGQYSQQKGPMLSFILL